MEFYLFNKKMERSDTITLGTLGTLAHFSHLLIGVLFVNRQQDRLSVPEDSNSAIRIDVFSNDIIQIV